MDLSTALIIFLFFYGIFMVLLGIEYYTDKSRKERAPPRHFASDLHNSQERTKENPHIGKLYLIGILCSILSQFLFFALTYYHTDLTTGRSWILFHPEHWNWAFLLSIVALSLIGLGIVTDVRRKERAPPQEIPSHIEKPQETERKEKPSEQLEDIEEPIESEEHTEEIAEREEPKETGAPKIWEEEEFE